MRVEPDDGEAAGARGQAADRADVGAAAAPEHERERRQVAPLAAIWSSSVASSTTAASGYGSASHAAAAIASPPSPHARGTRTSPAANSRPQLWHWYSVLDRDGGERPAVGAAGTERAQAIRREERVAG